VSHNPRHVCTAPVHAHRHHEPQAEGQVPNHEGVCV
jgi:hypothetical protein